MFWRSLGITRAFTDSSGHFWEEPEELWKELFRVKYLKDTLIPLSANRSTYDQDGNMEK